VMALVATISEGHRLDAGLEGCRFGAYVVQ
jgi:hypothetical protein